MKNIAMVSVDDLINVVRFKDVYGIPFQTPNIDRLVEMGNYFNAAYALVPACNPSRSAALTGQSLFRTGVEKNPDDFFGLVDPATTLPVALRAAGYETAATGKLFHGDFGPNNVGTPKGDFMQAAFDHYEISSGANVSGTTAIILESMGAGDYSDADMADNRAALWAGNAVIEMTARQQADESAPPWFVALGLKKPHLGWNVPQKYYDMIDAGNIRVPDHIPDDWDDVPLFHQQFIELRGHTHQTVLDADAWILGVHSYMAAVAFADAQLGLFLDAMDQAGAWETTTFVLWSDHGFHLGDRETWGKFTHWENGANAPLIIVDPDHGTPGTRIETPVSLLDIFPTLLDLAGAPDISGAVRDGFSLKTLMDNPAMDWTGFAGSFLDGSISLRTAGHRYILSLDGSEQLYDMETDPEQFVNLAADPASRAAPLLATLRQRAAEEVVRLGGQADFTGSVLGGGDGRDVLWVSPNIEAAHGGDGDDVYKAFSADAIVDSGGFDTLQLFGSHSGEPVHIVLPGTIENVEFEGKVFGRVDGTRTDERIIAAHGDDSLYGRGGDDVLNGRGGYDRISGGSGDDLIFGGSGSDVLKGNSGNDRIYGESRNDVLAGSHGDDHLDGGAGIDILMGGNGHDHLSGGSGSDTLMGGAGDDTLMGNNGRDVLRGNSGNDVLDGGGGADILSGGGGADRFVFVSARHSGPRAPERDTILDFEAGIDRIDLGAIDADTGRAGDQAFTLVDGGRFGDRAGELVIRDGLVLADIDGDGRADLSIRVEMAGGGVPGADDFVF